MRLYRVTFVTGFAAGFVLGTRAGRERYDQMRKVVRSVADNPSFQQAAGALQAQATGLMKSSWNRAATEGRKGIASVRGRLPHPGQAASPDAAMSGNGSASRRRNQRPFVPVNGDFGDRDLS